jgi:hypothetical protein
VKNILWNFISRLLSEAHLWFIIFVFEFNEIVKIDFISCKGKRL